MRKYLKFTSLGETPGVYAINGAGDFLLCINDIVGTPEFTGNGDDVILLLTSPNGSPTDAGTSIRINCTNSGNPLPAAQVVANAIIEAITTSPGGNVDLNPFLPKGYGIRSWEYESYIV